MGEMTSNKKPGDRSPGFLLHWGGVYLTIPRMP